MATHCQVVPILAILSMWICMHNIDLLFSGQNCICHQSPCHCSTRVDDCLTDDGQC